MKKVKYFLKAYLCVYLSFFNIKKIQSTCIYLYSSNIRKEK